MKLIIGGGKIDREAVRNKFGGLCAYTGKPLGDDWQVDHMQPVSHWCWPQPGYKKKVNDFDNLMPAIKIINHYKRDAHLEAFRKSMLTFHLRLAKLPKKTQRPQTIKRILYMRTIADLFDITVDKPFSGKFYFETLQ